MKYALTRRHVSAALAGFFAVSTAGYAGEATFLPNMLSFPNPTGLAATYSATGKIPLDGPFFQSLGSNGRSCGSCHQPGDGWTVIPSHIGDRFETSPDSIRFSGPMMGRIRLSPTSLLSMRDAMPTACC